MNSFYETKKERKCFAEISEIIKVYERVHGAAE